ncbi:hypothetical protein CHELA40_50465 [Chelatococcus asaccharovorans]|nr:hypothetical protein CHELA17_20431 [Chelatococcus asaccharovorans]CAH1692939.1 hypothetical protein CHELA40_50465 [Chelatococcus asaccharovorans]
MEHFRDSEKRENALARAWGLRHSRKPARHEAVTMPPLGSAGACVQFGKFLLSGVKRSVPSATARAQAPDRCR